MSNDFINEKLSKLAELSISYECQVVAILWNDIELYFEYYDILKKIIKNKIWKLYLWLGNELAINKYKKIDNIAIDTLFSNPLYEKRKELYEKYGGFQTIHLAMENVEVLNLEAHIKELKKLSIIFDYIKEMTITNERLDKLLEQNEAEDIATFFNVKIDDICSNLNEGGSIKVVSRLDENLEAMVEESNKGINMGLPINSPILNHEICGLREGEVILVAGLSGTGKSTLTQEIYLSAIWEQGESVVIFLNEQDIVKWQQQFLTWIINNVILKDSPQADKFNTKRWIQGKFTKKERELIDSAIGILKEKMNDNLIIIEELNLYLLEDVKKSVKKYAKMGIKYFALDTFKITSDYNSSHGTPWLKLQQDIRSYYDLVKKSNLNANFWITLQLNKEAVINRHLTGYNIGMAKNVVDTAGVTLLMRNMRDDEYEGGKKQLNVMSYDTTNITEKHRCILDDKEKQHTLIFIDKNRNGRSQQFQIVAEQNCGTIEWKEIGITNVPFGE